MRKGFIRKELKFNHDGMEFVVVVQMTQPKLDEATHKTRQGAVLNSARLFNMTAFRESEKK